eukprot:COSAG05_NODE_379_length_10567_cov_18.553687_12_plen_121_part_00
MLSTLENRKAEAAERAGRRQRNSMVRAPSHDAESNDGAGDGGTSGDEPEAGARAGAGQDLKKNEAWNQLFESLSSLSVAGRAQVRTCIRLRTCIQPTLVSSAQVSDGGVCATPGDAPGTV